MDRRLVDRCFAKRAWDIVEPYWMMGSTIVGTCALAFIAVVSWIYDVNGYEPRLTRVEHEVSDTGRTAEEIRFNLKALMNHLSVPYVERKE